MIGMFKFTKFRSFKWLTLLFTALVVVSLTACGGTDKDADGPTAGKKEVKTITIGYLNVMDDAQAMLADEAKLYEKYGLNAELKAFSSGTDLIKGIISGQLDAGVLGFTRTTRCHSHHSMSLAPLDVTRTTLYNSHHSA
jgi:NitT/TauT family transport system substrate-binding protein